MNCGDQRGYLPNKICFLLFREEASLSLVFFSLSLGFFCSFFSNADCHPSLTITKSPARHPTICFFFFSFRREQQQQSTQEQQDSHCAWRPANFPTSVLADLGFFGKLSSSTTVFQLESLRSVSGSSRNQHLSEVGHSCLGVDFELFLSVKWLFRI